MFAHMPPPSRILVPPLPCSDNLEVFRQNGFEFRDEPGTGRLLLTAVPFRWA